MRYEGRHRAPRIRRRRLPAAMFAIAVLLALPLSAVTASPAAHASTLTLGDRVLNAAETRAGDWYVYGTAGPSTFDCSGLVAWAAGRVGIYVPHSTYSMLAGTTHLYRIPLSQARRGDLLFFGSGHVEIDTIWYHQTFGAHHSGTRVSWRGWNSYYAPTMAMRFR